MDPFWQKKRGTVLSAASHLILYRPSYQCNHVAIALEESWKSDDEKLSTVMMLWHQRMLREAPEIDRKFVVIIRNRGAALKLEWRHDIVSFTAHSALSTRRFLPDVTASRKKIVYAHRYPGSSNKVLRPLI